MIEQGQRIYTYQTFSASVTTGETETIDLNSRDRCEDRSNQKKGNDAVKSQCHGNRKIRSSIRRRVVQCKENYTKAHHSNHRHHHRKQMIARDKALFGECHGGDGGNNVKNKGEHHHDIGCLLVASKLFGALPCSLFRHGCCRVSHTLIKSIALSVTGCMARACCSK